VIGYALLLPVTQVMLRGLSASAYIVDFKAGLSFGEPQGRNTSTMISTQTCASRDSRLPDFRRRYLHESASFSKSFAGKPRSGSSLGYPSLAGVFWLVGAVWWRSDPFFGVLLLLGIGMF
jgi:hypothetical protein